MLYLNQEPVSPDIVYLCLYMLSITEYMLFKPTIYALGLWSGLSLTYSLRKSAQNSDLIRIWQSIYSACRPCLNK